MALTSQFVYAGKEVPPYGAYGQVLVKTDSAFYYTSWADIANVINLTSDVASISGSKIDANFNGQEIIGSGLSIYSQASIKFYDQDNSNYLAFRAPASVPADVVWVLPSGDGSPNQLLSTTGAGVLQWATVSGGGGGGATVVISGSPPPSGNVGDIWFDSDDGRSYVYYNDGTSSQWIEMNPSWNGGVGSGVVNEIDGGSAATIFTSSAFVLIDGGSA